MADADRRFNLKRHSNDVRLIFRFGHGYNFGFISLLRYYVGIPSTREVYNNRRRVHLIISNRRVIRRRYSHYNFKSPLARCAAPGQTNIGKKSVGRFETRDTFMSEGYHKPAGDKTRRGSDAGWTETENSFRILLRPRGVADSARFQAPLKNPT